MNTIVATHPGQHCNHLSLVAEKRNFECETPEAVQVYLSSVVRLQTYISQEVSSSQLATTTKNSISSISNLDPESASQTVPFQYYDCSYLIPNATQ